jgi:hypothetical protein
MLKNIAGQSFHVIAFNASGRVSGDAANITCQLKIDDGNRGPTIDINPTEIGTTGEYVFTLTQAETNGHALSFTPISSTGGVQVLGSPSNIIYTDDLTPKQIWEYNTRTLTSNAPIPGYILVTLQVDDDLDGIEVLVTRNANGTNAVFSGVSVNGTVTGLLPLGTLYVFRTHPEYQFVNPYEILVEES